MSDASQSLLPPNSTALERGLSLATERASTLPVRIRDAWSPQNCPAGMLPWLAWALSVDEWDAAWSEQQKRDTIAASIQVHRVKGTLGALRRALSALGHEVIIDEKTGAAHTFKISLDASKTGGDAPLLAKAEIIARSAKNVRSHLLSVGFFVASNCTLSVGTAAHDGNTTTVFPSYTREMDFPGVCHAASCAFLSDTLTVIPPFRSGLLFDDGTPAAWDDGTPMTF
jgi:phage tail P2-like protein